MIELFVQEFPNKEYTGLDLTPKMIEVASQKNLPQTTFIVGDSENLPFEDESFDVITCTDMFFLHLDRMFLFRAFRSSQRILLLHPSC